MRHVDVFAVEDTAVQVCWRGLRPGCTLSTGDESVEVTSPGPGAAALGGLPPATVVTVTLRGDGPARAVATARTLAPPPGELLCRFATVNDTHVGERRFGILRRLRDDPSSGLEPYALRCVRAALGEALAWGAQSIVAKGDLTYTGRPQQWSDVGHLLGGLGVPVAAVLGNHDVGRKAVDGREALARHGIEVPADPYRVDLPGLRVVLGHTSIPHRGHGTMPGPQRDQIADLLSAAPGPAFVGMHHYAQRYTHPLTYPPGIPGHEARALLDTVAEANPATFVTAGHSHRNRRRYHGPVVVTEVGATMHYPGTWAGYAVHEGGIRQVVFRVAAPEAIAWTERTRRAAGGVWGLVAPGLRSHRCFSHPWPRR